MSNLETYYKKSQPLEDYIADMTTNKNNVLAIYDAFSIPSNDSKIESLKNASFSKVLVITEDWCGDAMMNLPILTRISEYLNLEVRVFHRDEDTDLIDRYLTNGTARSIPIFIFLNDNFEQVNVWGPRAREAQEFVTNLRAEKLPAKDDPTYEEKEKEVHQEIVSKYINDTELWNQVYDSIVTKLSL
ncbi:thioredoxin family protein [Staphylococcus pragensis]|uniref:Thioredoxin family protein n=1 Tax=Staphylococcus pragensis TaxID=1611836 RepID=A0A4Z1BNZ4_9STAP|nr:thioredoxin family protein [Staphylococcus pragensis]RTX89089.1 thioredoxin family protein [Staphylococcus carnosus]TGN26549.1 thioredoxin family protein [Staphylococcus pragensis]GGG95054.1 thioredoxin [Staphylococcus pragensis]